MMPMEEIAAFADVPVSIEVELGRPLMKLRDILELETGSVLCLTRAAGENIDVRAAGVHPMLHYMLVGRWEGRAPRPPADAEG